MSAKWRPDGQGLHFAELAGHTLIVSEHGRAGAVDFYRWGVKWRRRFVGFGFHEELIGRAKANAEQSARRHLVEIGDRKRALA